MNRDQLIMTFKNESLIARQRYASSCMRRYCEHKRIYHPAINALLNHLESINSDSNLVEWDTLGAQLDLNGRGDPIPESLKLKIPAEELCEFSQLVDSVVEVGLINLYGDKTDLPIHFLNKIMQILERNSIPLPSLDK